VTHDRPRRTLPVRLVAVLTRTHAGRTLGVGAWLLIVGALTATGTGYGPAVAVATVLHVAGATALHAAHARLTR